ncbi:MAG: hypothetical protein MJ125_01200 [Clostridia bacterium]|nr:hypothetical protein [Clostridia bacterium]
MAYIREKTEERTGYQNGAFLTPEIDSQCDFVMVYRLDETSAERVKQYRDAGYVIHFMTGISWGGYQDYLYGRYDGIDHWDEAQEDRYGNRILHSRDVPYMVPTVAFSDYLTEKLKVIVDMGVEAIHVEEPEFWDRAGYSPAFKREYELYYRTPWVAPHESVDAKFRCSKLKAYLFTRCIDRVSSALKEYAKVKYNKNLRFYVPTHSLLNYTQWKIVSPEGKLSDIPAVDGCIAQVWTGTSREKNWYNGVFAERTFETAFLEYGVMQELVKGTGRKMWFLHDPIEDNPEFDWDDYKKNYFEIVTASLLHPKVNTYEICPWPTRVFNGKYPKNSPDAVGIPGDYATILNNTFHTLGNIECDASFKGAGKIRTGILCGDSQLYQREYPDCEFPDKPVEEVGTVLVPKENEINEIREKLFGGEDNKPLMLKYMSSNALPSFYGLAMPLLKKGIPVRPVLIDNVKRYAGYLDDYDVLVMSYEYMKPESPDVNACLADWVNRGGTLIYVGDGFDPFHSIDSWWSGKYKTSAHHLFEMTGIDADKEIQSAAYGKGRIGYWNYAPSKILWSGENADKYREIYASFLKDAGYEITWSDNFEMHRGDYVIAAVLDEEKNAESLELKGVYADMFSPDFEVKRDYTVNAGECAFLLDLEKTEDIILGTSVRITSLDMRDYGCEISCRGAGDFTASIRLRLPFDADYSTVDGEKINLVKDEIGGSVLLRFESTDKERNIRIYRKN